MSSICLVSIIINSISSGVAPHKILIITEWRQVDLPEPVVPPIKTCDTSLKFIKNGSPSGSFPNATLKSNLEESDFDSNTSFKVTNSMLLLGTSMPIIESLLTGNFISISGTDKLRAISDDNFTISLILTLGWSLILYLVTDGPWRISIMSALILNLLRVLINFCAFLKSELL